jgi:hypothetical protein
MPQISSVAATAGPSVDPEHPWLGLQSFTEENQQYFFGRTNEIRDIFLRVREERLTVMYGQSGLGKTSLLRAGLIPKLRIEHFRPVHVLLEFSADSPSLVEQARIALAQACARAKSEPAWKFLLRWKPLRSLWEIGAHEELRAQDMEESPPVLIFDQFEEVFTLGQGESSTPMGRAAEVVELFTQLADLVENRAPAALTDKFATSPKEALSYDFRPTPVRIVISLREDYLAQLEEWKSTMPSLMRNRMALRLLSGRQALEAVVRPGRMEGRNLISDEVGARIVRFVAQQPATTPLEVIEAVPPLISLVCERLNEARLSTRPPLTQITADLVESQGVDILQRFYDESFLDFPESYRTPIRAYIEDHMITRTGGHRIPVAWEDAQDVLGSSGVPDPEHALRHLIGRRLLISERRGGIQRLEITHDVLAPLVVHARDERHAEEKAARERAEAEDRARVAEAEARVAAERAAAESERQTRELLRARRMAISFATLGLVAAVLGLVAAIFYFSNLAAWNNARKAREFAESKANDATKSSEEATKASEDARKAREFAESKARDAEKERNRALDSIKLAETAARNLVKTVVDEDIGLPGAPALALLDGAKALYEKMNAEADAIPEVRQGQSYLHFAYEQLFIRGELIRGELGAEELKKLASRALREADESIELATLLTKRSDKNDTENQRLLSHAYRLKGEVLFAITDEEVPMVKTDSDKQIRPASFQDAEAAYVTSSGILETLKSSHPELSSDANFGVELAQTYIDRVDVYRKLHSPNDQRLAQSAAILHDAENAIGAVPNAGTNFELRALQADIDHKLGNLDADTSRDEAERGDHKNANIHREEALKKWKLAYDRRSGLISECENRPIARKFKMALAFSCANLAGVLIELKRPAEARGYFEQRIVLNEALNQVNPANAYWRAALAEGHCSYAEALMNYNIPIEHRKELAVEHAHKAVAITEERNQKYLEVYRRALGGVGDNKEIARVKSVLQQLAERQIAQQPNRQ